MSSPPVTSVTTQDPSETRTWIGARWTRGDTWSRGILIDREASHSSLKKRAMISHTRRRPGPKAVAACTPAPGGFSVTDDDAWCFKASMQFFSTRARFAAHRLGLVVRAEGSHPIPSRTRKLSPPAPMVLRRRRRERVGRCQSLISPRASSTLRALAGLLAFLACVVWTRISRGEQTLRKSRSR